MFVNKQRSKSPRGVENDSEMWSLLKYSLVKESKDRCHLFESWEVCLSQQKDSSYHLEWRKNHRFRKWLIFWVKKDGNRCEGQIYNEKGRDFVQENLKNMQCSGFSIWELMDMPREAKATAKAFQLCVANVFHIFFLFQVKDIPHSPSNNDTSWDRSLIM